MASLYLVKAANDAISSDYQADPANWWPGWQTDLGAPKGNRYMWDGLWRRDFANGFVLTNEPGSPSRTAQLGGTYNRLSRGPVSSVTLGAASGAVLIARVERIRSTARRAYAEHAADHDIRAGHRPAPTTTPPEPTAGEQQAPTRRRARPKRRRRG